MARKRISVAAGNGPRQPVGYGMPPVETRFKQGKSGNPNGRPRRPKNRKGLKEVLRRSLDRKVQAREGEKSHHITKGEAVIQVLLNQALKGHVPAIRKLLDLIQEVDEVDEQAAPQTELSAEDRETLKRYLERDQDDSGTLEK